MTFAHWQQVKTILADALEDQREADRREFVAVSCRGDLVLKAQVDALLAQDDSTWCDDAFLSGLRATLLISLPPVREVCQSEQAPKSLD